jgi:hypothetical protein
LQDEDVENHLEGLQGRRVFKSGKRQDAPSGDGDAVKRRILATVSSLQRAAGNLFVMTSSVVTRGNHGIDLSHEKWDVNVGPAVGAAAAASGCVVRIAPEDTAAPADSVWQSKI